MGKGVKRRVADALELPKEVLLNLPLISLIGKEEVGVENFKGILEYHEETVRVNTTAGVLRIQGQGLKLKQLTAEQILVTGQIKTLEFLQ